jgi:hypothetical protein
MGANPIGSEDLKSVYSVGKFHHHHISGLYLKRFSGPITASISEADNLKKCQCVVALMA